MSHGSFGVSLTAIIGRGVIGSAGSSVWPPRRILRGFHSPSIKAASLRLRVFARQPCIKSGRAGRFTWLDGNPRRLADRQPADTVQQCSVGQLLLPCLQTPPVTTSQYLPRPAPSIRTPMVHQSAAP